MLIPIFASLAYAISTITEKIVLTKKKLGIKFYQTYGFLLLVIMMIPLLFFFWKLTPEALYLKNILIFLLITISATLANYLIFLAIKNINLTKFEPATIMEPIFIVFLTFIFSFIFGQSIYSRDTRIMIPALIAGIALIIPYIQKHHLKFNRYFLIALLGSFLFAFELTISNLILRYYSEITFYFLRCIAITIFSFILFKPETKLSKTTKIIPHIILINALWIVYRILIYYGYNNLGIIYTTLLIMLGPVLVYFGAWIILKEKVKTKNIISSLIILLCVIYVTIF